MRDGFPKDALRDTWVGVNEDCLVANSPAWQGVVVACVYVIGPLSGPVKIGKAANPVSRLFGIQNGNPYRLFIHDVFWVCGIGSSDIVELDAHAIAAQSHSRLMGEWFDCNSEEAASAIEMACIKNDVPFHTRLPFAPKKTNTNF